MQKTNYRSQDITCEYITGDIKLYDFFLQITLHLNNHSNVPTLQ